MVELPTGGKDDAHMSEPTLAGGGAPGSPDPDADLLARLLVHKYNPMMHRIALTYVRAPSVAEEVVQDAWVGMLRSLERFEGRSLLRTWLLRILTNRARSRGVREARSVPFSALGDDDPSVAPERFQGPEERFPGGWRAFPTDWSTLPEQQLLSQETLAHVDAAIRMLPGRQHEVMLLRDIEGWSAEEVCDALGLSAGNQRVLLHRARSRVRQALETYLEPA
jgi:RNA polymerase sigma-70 factor, ECF subfamily